jgi:hypothetical protein
MKQNQFNYLNMVGAVIAGMRKEQALWENEPEIGTLFTSIVSEYDMVNLKSESVSGTDTTGYTSAKDNAFDRLVAASFKLSRKLSAYAKLRNDFVLLPLVDISLTSLSRGPEKEVIARCGAIADQAQNHLSQLATFKVTESEISEVRELVGEYFQNSGDRSTASSGKSVTGKEIPEHIAALRHKLDTLDDLVEGLIDDAGFIARYKDLRMIIDYGKGKTLKNKETEKVTA